MNQADFIEIPCNSSFFIEKNLKPSTCLESDLEKSQQKTNQQFNEENIKNYSEAKDEALFIRKKVLVLLNLLLLEMKLEIIKKFVNILRGKTKFCKIPEILKKEEELFGDKVYFKTFLNKKSNLDQIGLFFTFVYKPWLFLC